MTGLELANDFDVKTTSVWKSKQGYDVGAYLAIYVLSGGIETSIELGKQLTILIRRNNTLNWGPVSIEQEAILLKLPNKTDLLIFFSSFPLKWVNDRPGNINLWMWSKGPTNGAPDVMNSNAFIRRRS